MTKNEAAAPRCWRAGRFNLSLDRPRIMAIVNLTPDSFSGDGVGENVTAALRRAEAAVEAGADILDFGAESTRPGAATIPVEAEWARLEPALTAVRDWPVVVSVDTRKAEVMRRAADAGADVLNDVSGFRDPEAVTVAAATQCGLCVMHMQGEPSTMQLAPHYDDVVAEVEAFLLARAQALQEAGVAAERLVIDPGFGFGKTLEHNLALFRALPRLAQHYPLLVGVSRKRMIGELTGRQDPKERMVGSAVAAALAVAKGAAIVRVHDVAATRDALAVWRALGDEEQRS